MSDLSGATKRRRGPLTLRERVVAQSLGGLIWSATSFISRSTFSRSSEIGGGVLCGLDLVERQNRKPDSTSRLAKLFREFKRVSILHWTPPLNGGRVLQPFSYQPSCGTRIEIHGCGY